MKQSRFDMCLGATATVENAAGRFAFVPVTTVTIGIDLAAGDTDQVVACQMVDGLLAAFRRIDLDNTQHEHRASLPRAVVPGGAALPPTANPSRLAGQLVSARPNRLATQHDHEGQMHHG